MKRKQQALKLSQISYYYQQIHRHIGASNISAHAGETAFFFILSFFPFTMFLLSLLQYTPLSEDIIIKAMQMILPSSFDKFLRHLINEIYRQSGTILPITIITAVWMGSKSFLSLIRGLNDMYQVPEKRNYIHVRIIAFLYTILFAVLLLATLTILVFGNTLYYHLCKIFPKLHDPLLSVISLRSTVGFIIMLLFFSMLYRFIPHRKATFLQQLPGALVATSGWILFSYLYSYYVDHLSNYSFFYGTMTTIALLMVWLYACMYLLFCGGLINHLIMDFSDTSHSEK